MRHDKIIRLGQGALGWPPLERVSDRYGTVMLTLKQGEPSPLSLPPWRSRRRLVAEVLESRPTRHAGDWARGLVPMPLAVGTTVALCDVGRFITERDRGRVLVGVRPADGRQNHWLDPQVLFGLVEQIVRLDFQPA